METIAQIKAKYPKLSDDLDAALKLQEQSASVGVKALYKEKQEQINALIPKLIDLAKVWDEQQLRYTITKIEILRDEILSIERNSKAYDVLVEQIESGEFDEDEENDK